jgi:chorismate mutase/prephenate dehydratase
MRVSFQGERGAYSEEAIIQHFGRGVEPVPRPYLRDVFDSIEEGKADLGLVPVENSIEGSIVRTYDLLNERRLKAQGEVVLRVVHCLIANLGVAKEDVLRVHSHPQALGQCRDYLERHGYEPVSSYDTAGSVKMLKELGLRDSAAIASKRAAEVYEMEVLDSGIETHHENYTRFLVIGRDDMQPTSRDKTSIAFIVDHRPGTLYTALKAFAENGIDLTKIESRPMLGKPWEYIFFIDVIGHREDSDLSAALGLLGESSRSVKILGSYPRAPKPQEK